MKKKVLNKINSQLCIWLLFLPINNIRKILTEKKIFKIIYKISYLRIKYYIGYIIQC